MKESSCEPCERYKTCKECLINHYKHIYPNIEEIVSEGAKVMLSVDILGMDKRESTIKIINNAVIIDDGANEDFLCNCISEDEAECRSIELITKEIKVPLSWEEIDQIVLALRVTNQAFKGSMRDKLEEKMNSYSTKAKEI